MNIIWLVFVDKEQKKTISPECSANFLVSQTLPGQIKTTMQYTTQKTKSFKTFLFMINMQKHKD